MALVMESLGFQMQADCTVIRDLKDRSANLHAATRFEEAPYVFLVADDHGATDPTRIMYLPRA